MESGREGPVRWLFTDRRGGVSVGAYDSLNLAEHVGDEAAAVEANRQRVAVAIGARPDRLVVMRIEHGNRVAVATGQTGDPLPGSDGLVTAEAGLALMAMAADCLPVLLYDADSGIVGAVHSGWMGVRDGVLPAAVAAMAHAGATDLTAVVGPAICGGCYAVPAERVDQVAAVVPEAAGSTPDGRPSLDLPGAALSVLTRLGVRASTLGICTAESPRHFSYRRDHRTGRQAGVIMLDEA